jgi:hypothetical protein
VSDSTAYAQAHDELERADELDAVRTAISMARESARRMREDNLPGSAAHDEGVADRLQRLLDRLEKADGS